MQIVPDIDDPISGRAQILDIRGVDSEDLLTRVQVVLEDSPMQASLLGKSVMIVGAGGLTGALTEM